MDNVHPGKGASSLDSAVTFFCELIQFKVLSSFTLVGGGGK